MIIPMPMYHSNSTATPHEVGITFLFICLYMVWIVASLKIAEITADYFNIDDLAIIIFLTIFLPCLILGLILL